MSKKKSPYALEKDYWDKLPRDARQWMDKYAKAVEFGNFNVLRQLCDDAPSDQFEEIKADVMYERDFYKRDQYTIPSQHNSKYTEWDYSWAAPESEDTRTAIREAYAVSNNEPEFYSAPSKKVKFK